MYFQIGLSPFQNMRKNKVIKFDLMEDVIYLDNAASTPPFNKSIENYNEFLKTYGSIHRGSGVPSIQSSKKFENSRSGILDLMSGNEDEHALIFTGNTTDSINKLSDIFRGSFKKILTSNIEHSANLLPWKRNFIVEVFDVTETFEIDLNKIEEYLSRDSDIGLLALSGMSNITGKILDLEKVYDLCKKYNVLFSVDASQYAQHKKINMNHMDFVSFSGHKLYAPFGIGVLAGRIDKFKNSDSQQTGGGNICYVNGDHSVVYKGTSHSHEIGTPNGPGAYGLFTSMKIVYDNFDFIEKNEALLYEEVFEMVNEIFPENIVENIEKPLILLDFKNKNINSVVKEFSNENIACRHGNFCVYEFIRLVKDKDVSVDNCSEIKDGVIRLSIGLTTEIKDLKERLIRIKNKIS